MNISLTPELENFIKQKVDGGLYTSASEVVRESLRLMHTYDDVQKQRLFEIRKSIDVGMEQVRNEEYVDGNDSRKRMKRKVDAFVKGKA
jgi:antitoxin ParD1/3/4